MSNSFLQISFPEISLVEMASNLLMYFEYNNFSILLRMNSLSLPKLPEKTILFC